MAQGVSYESFWDHGSNWVLAIPPHRPLRYHEKGHHAIEKDHGI